MKSLIVAKSAQKFACREIIILLYKYNFLKIIDYIDYNIKGTVSWEFCFNWDCGGLD